MRALLAASARTVVLTGAGVSAARGAWAQAVNTPWDSVWAPTWEAAREGAREGARDGTADGTGGGARDAPSPPPAAGPAARLDALWRHGGALRQAGLAVQATAVHLALARCEAALRPDQAFLLLTLNIDGLHQRAGSQRVVELRGSLRGTRCCRPGCRLPPFADDRGYPGGAPRCPACGGLLRPDVVLPGEPLPVDATWQAQRALRALDLLVAIGTGGQDAWVQQAAQQAQAAGARTVFIDHPDPARPPAAPDPLASVLVGDLDTLVPALLG